MRRYAAPWPPGLGQFGQRLGVWPLAQIERDAGGLLYREIAGRKGVGVAETEQEIDVGGPRPDAVQCDQRGMRLVGRHVADGIEIDVLLSHRLADFFDRFYFRRRQAEPLELVGARAADRIV